MSRSEAFSGDSLKRCGAISDTSARPVSFVSSALVD